MFIVQFAYSQNIKEEPFSYSAELLSAAKKGNTDAMYKIGICYYVGRPGTHTSDVKKSKDDLTEMLRSIGNLSSTLPESQSNVTDRLTILIQNDIPFAQDYKKALKYLQKAGRCCRNVRVHVE